MQCVSCVPLNIIFRYCFVRSSQGWKNMCISTGNLYKYKEKTTNLLFVKTQICVFKFYCFWGKFAFSELIFANYKKTNLLYQKTNFKTQISKMQISIRNTNLTKRKLRQKTVKCAFKIHICILKHKS